MTESTLQMGGRRVINGEQEASMASMHHDLEGVLESAARLQQLVPDAVLVRGTAAAFHARQRGFVDHGHVLRDLAGRFDAVLEAT